MGAGVAAAVVANYGVLFAVDRMAADRCRDRAALARRRPVHHRQVLAGGDAPLDLRLQRYQGLLTFGHHDAAGGVLIEPVHDAGPQLTANARQVGAVMQQPIHQGAVFVARGWMHREAGGLVDHDQVLVFVEHIELHRLGLQVGQRFRRRHPQLHRVVLTQRRLGLAGNAIDAHVAGVDEFLDASATLLRPLAHQPAIQPHGQRLGVGEGQQLAVAGAEAGHRRRLAKGWLGG